LGTFFRSDSRSHTRTELLVLITPYVLMTPQEALAETKRLHAASNASADKWYRGWSDSPLADFTPEQKKEREQIEKEKQRLLKLRDKEEARQRLSRTIVPPSFRRSGPSARRCRYRIR
jgi:type II secretory pathway component GspD/PulD (secretin)